MIFVKLSSLRRKEVNSYCSLLYLDSEKTKQYLGSMILDSNNSMLLSTLIYRLRFVNI